MLEVVVAGRKYPNNVINKFIVTKTFEYFLVLYSDQQIYLRFYLIHLVILVTCFAVGH